jgi:hypothetical protein
MAGAGHVLTTAWWRSNGRSNAHRAARAVCRRDCKEKVQSRATVPAVRGDRGVAWADER